MNEKDAERVIDILEKEVKTKKTSRKKPVKKASKKKTKKSSKKRK